jgi:hypothetical protein
MSAAKFERVMARLGWVVVLLALGIAMLPLGDALVTNLKPWGAARHEVMEPLAGLPGTPLRPGSARVLAATPAMLKVRLSLLNAKSVIAFVAKESRRCLAAAPGFVITGSGDDLVRYVEATSYGDELWIFCSPADHWRHLTGRFGVARLSSERIVDELVLVMN